MSSGMEDVKDIDALGGEVVAGEGVGRDGPAGVVAVEGEIEGTGFEVVAGDVDGGSVIGVVGVHEHDAIRDSGEFGCVGQGTEGVFRVGLADMMGEEDGEVIGIGDAFEGREDSGVLGRFLGVRMELGQGIDDEETGGGVLLEPGFEGIEAAIGEKGPGVLPKEGMGRWAGV